MTTALHLELQASPCSKVLLLAQEVDIFFNSIALREQRSTTRLHYKKNMLIKILRRQYNKFTRDSKTEAKKSKETWIAGNYKQGKGVT